MAQNQIRLDKNGGVPLVRVSVMADASGARGSGRVRLWDRDGRNPEDAGKFRIPDDGSEIPALKLLKDGSSVGSLKQRTLTWAVRIAPLRPGDAGRYEVRVWVEQDERAVPGGEFLYSGPLDDVEEIGDVALLMVA